jgi:hypothetical protein
VTLAAAAGPLGVTGPVRGRGAVAITARDAIALGDVVSETAKVTIRLGVGWCRGTSIDAGTDIETRGEGALTLRTLNARGVGGGGSALLTSRAGGSRSHQVQTLRRSARTPPRACRSRVAPVGTAATLAARDITIGTLSAGSLDAKARGALQIGTATIGGAATLDVAGAATITSLAAASLTLKGGGDATLGPGGDAHRPLAGDGHGCARRGDARFRGRDHGRGGPGAHHRGARAGAARWRSRRARGRCGSTAAARRAMPSWLDRLCRSARSTRAPRS